MSKPPASRSRPARSYVPSPFLRRPFLDCLSTFHFLRFQGQGIANSVGLAIAAKQLAAQFNRPGYDIVDNKIWCFTGDGCIQEGVGQEGAELLPLVQVPGLCPDLDADGLLDSPAISLAGHLALDNLVLVYDCNKVRTRLGSKRADR